MADQLYALLSNPPRKDDAPPPAAPAADISGQWDVKVEYAAGTSNHALNLRQSGNEIDGSHRGDFLPRDLTGTIDGDNVRLRSFFSEQTAIPSTTRSRARSRVTRWAEPSTWANTWAASGRRGGAARGRRG